MTPTAFSRCNRSMVNAVPCVYSGQGVATSCLFQTLLAAAMCLAGCVTTPQGDAILERPLTAPARANANTFHPRVVINNPTFDLDEVALSAVARHELDTAVRLLKRKAGLHVAIEGHTCSAGDAGYNDALGLRRAEAVKAYLARCGIAPGRIVTRSFGERQPAVKNAADPVNRRVELRFFRGANE